MLLLYPLLCILLNWFESLALSDQSLRRYRLQTDFVETLIRLLLLSDPTAPCDGGGMY